MTTLTGREYCIISFVSWCFHSSKESKQKHLALKTINVLVGGVVPEQCLWQYCSAYPSEQLRFGVNSGNRVYLKHWDFDPNPVLVQKVGLPSSLTFWVFAYMYLSLTKPFDIPMLASITFLELERARRSEMPVRSTMSVHLSGLDVSILLVQEPWPVVFSFVEYFFQHLVTMHLQHPSYVWSTLWVPVRKATLSQWLMETYILSDHSMLKLGFSLKTKYMQGML